MENILNISASPHIRDNSSVRRIMTDVIIALVPSVAYAVYHFGWYSLCVIISCMVFSMLVEACYQKITGNPVTVSDGSAALTGLLIAMNMPPEIPIAIPLIGCAFAIIMVKQIFGGLGYNFMNPALAARCFLLISFAKHMTYFTVDGVSSATPLMLIKEGTAIDKNMVFNMFVGNIGGVIGETSALALLIGAAYLMIRKVISPVIPIAYIGTFAVFIALFGGHLMQPDIFMYVLAQLFGGGLMLGALFMATDYVTGPITTKGRIIYGIFIGLLTGLFRVFGSNAEGVSYAIIIGNMITPLIDKNIHPKAFGVEYKKEKVKTENTNASKEDNQEKYKAPAAVKRNAFIVMTCIAIAAGIALGYIYQQTKDIIAQRKADDTKAAYAKVCSDAKEFTPINGNYDTLLASSGEDYGNIVVGDVLEATDISGNTVGTVVDITTKDGYGGDIQLAVGINNENSVIGVEILSINETAGLGMNAEKDLVPQYPKKSGNLKVAKDGGEIQAISGATITSRAVTNAVSAALYIAEGK
ncbi:MAG: RnfABCDGE type electron transport complex subunit D [Clostridia bacterium]|nr:RnfABCDGE type electron transport complex subunit D [Clostridia bacterium]